MHDHSTEYNDTSVQFLYFTKRNTQHCNDTKQSKAQRHTAQFTAHCIQTTPFTVHKAVRSIYRVPQTAPGCQLLLICKQPVRTLENLSCVTHWVAAGHCVVVKYFYERSFAVLLTKCALKHRYSRGAWRDRKARSVQYAN